MKRFYLLLLTLLYALVIILFIFNHLLDINPDGISYIEKALFFKNGLVSESISSYWSPAYSFLLVPLSFFMSWITSTKILTLILSLAWLLVSYECAHVFLKNRNSALLVTLLLLVFTGSYEMWILITPDLLLTVYSVSILILFHSLVGTTKFRQWYLFGVFLGIGYLIKNSFLIISLVTFPLGVVLLNKIGKTRTLLGVIAGLFTIVILWTIIVFLVRGALPNSNFFITLLYALNKNNEFLTKPMSYPQHGTSYWTEPFIEAGIPFNFSGYAFAVLNNSRETVKFLLISFNIGIVFIVVSLKKLLKNKELSFLLFYSLAYVIFYCLILVEARYLWPIITPILVLIVASMSTKVKPLIFIYIFISVMLFSKTYFSKLPVDQNSLLHKQISEKIIAPCVLLSDQWQRGLYIAFWSGCKYYGVTNAKLMTDYKNALYQDFSLGKVTHFVSFDSTRYDSDKELIKINSWGYAGNKTATLYKINEY